MERIGNLAEHSAGMSADPVEVDLIGLDSGGLVNDFLIAGAVDGDAGLKLRVMLYIILHSL